MLLRNPHVKKPVRVTLGESFQPRAVRHGGSKGYQMGVLTRQAAQFFGKYVRIAGVYLFFPWLARTRVERLHAVEPGRVLLCRAVPFPLLGIYMNQDRMVHFSGFFKDFYHSLYVMAVYRPQIGDAHIFKQHPRDHQLFDAVFSPADFIYQALPDKRYPVQDAGHGLF